ncbi:MAG: GAF domain-containing protein, partial [Anaerolineae bacterium]|nr:GAF domain-containing protein [Anaerolineae bacterium]
MSKMLEALYSLSKLFHTETRLEPLATLMMREAGQLLNGENALLVIFDADGNPTDALTWGLSSINIHDENWQLWLYSSIISLTYHTQRVVIISNISADPRWGNITHQTGLPKNGSALGIPLIYDTSVIGVMVFLHPQIGHFGNELSALADEVGALCAGHLHKTLLLRWATGEDVRDKLEKAQLQRDLSAMVYHDLRVPLQTLRASSTKLAELLANHDNFNILNLLQMNIRSVRQLRRLVDNLLDMERLENGDAFIKQDWANLHDIMTHAIDLVQPLALEANQHFQFILADNLPPLMVDADMILRVIVNLIENALKYSPTGGNITIGARIKDGMAWVNVQDTGNGIPKEMQQSIFDKFSRAHQHSTTHKSIGLGLTFCRLAIQAHGGDIWVESEMGKGSNFIFTLPLPFSTANTDTAQSSASSDELAS